LSSSPSNKHVSDDDNNSNHHHRIISRRSEIVVILSLLAAFTILAIRPFGFRAFLASMNHGELYPIAIIFGIIAVVLVLMQRLGVIFVESSGDRYTQKGKD
jgi:hypothetical protein